MKQKLIYTCLVILTSCFAINISAQGQGKDKQKKEYSVKDKGNKDVDKSQGKDKVKDNGNANKHKKDDPGVVRSDDNYDKKDGKIKEKYKKDGSYDWDREKFKDRKKIRNEGKVTVCHKLNRGDDRPVSITISRNALKAHLAHGDVEGNCPTYTGKNRFSEKFLGKRGDYYNTLYGAQDQVIYSESILDYALQRLTGARTQLVTLQNSNATADEIQRKQAVVADLENNVSLLETVLTAVAGLLVGKLVD